MDTCKLKVPSRNVPPAEQEDLCLHILNDTMQCYLPFWEWGKKVEVCMYFMTSEIEHVLYSYKFIFLGCQFNIFIWLPRLFWFRRFILYYMCSRIFPNFLLAFKFVSDVSWGIELFNFYVIISVNLFL